MDLHNTALEIPFDAQIDGCFPYNDTARCSALIAEARSISLNAIFMILDEICRPPFLGEVARNRQHELLAEWASGFEHEMKKPLLTCAAALIDRSPIAWPEAVVLMEWISGFHGQRAALSVAYFSGDPSTSEGDTALSSTADRIRNLWEAKGV